MSLFFGARKSSSGHLLQRQNSVSSVASNMSGMGENTVSIIANGMYSLLCILNWIIKWESAWSTSMTVGLS
jgi:hypothetical protein